MHASGLAVLAALLCAQPAANAADDWATLWRQNSLSLPSPATATAGDLGDFGLGIEGRAWLMVRTRYHRLHYQASLDRGKLAEIYARIDNLYDFLSERSPVKAKPPLAVYLMPEELGHSRCSREAKAMRTGAQGDVDFILSSLLHEETHLFNFAYLGERQQGWWCGEFTCVYFQERARLEAGREDVKAGLKSRLADGPTARLAELDGLGENALAEAASVLFYLEETYGRDRLNLFRRKCLERSKALNGTALSKLVFQEVFGRDVAALDQEWRAFYGWRRVRDTSHLSVEQRLDVEVTYGTGQASVQTVVAELARQAGLLYNRQKSYQQTDPVCRRWVRDLVIRNKPCRQALDDVLKKVGLRYQMEDSAIVLYPK